MKKLNLLLLALILSPLSTTQASTHDAMETKDESTPQRLRSATHEGSMSPATSIGGSTSVILSAEDLGAMLKDKEPDEQLDILLSLYFRAAKRLSKGNREELLAQIRQLEAQKAEAEAENSWWSVQSWTKVGVGVAIGAVLTKTLPFLFLQLKG